MSTVKRAYCLMGPTASGKTTLACELLQIYPFEIISVDSALIYRGMDIGTAKPSQAELKIAPHHLIDIVDPIESYSAAEFCTDAQGLCEQIHQRGKIPLLVGGTMMYFNALQNGLSRLPEAEPTLRTELEEEAQRVGWPALHWRLQQCDPIAAGRIKPQDGARIVRALEVYTLTGRPLSAWQMDQKPKQEWQFVNLALIPSDRAWLHNRIAQRLETMFAAGFIEEVQALDKQWCLEESLPAMRCVGYRQVLAYLRGAYDLATLREKTTAATRQLAKRQLTWLRHWEDAQVYLPERVGFQESIKADINIH